MKIAFLILAGFCAVTAVAQDSAPPQATNSAESESSNSSSLRRLAGVRDVMFGREATKSFLVPELRFEQSYDSNAQGVVPGSDEKSVLGGSLTLQHNSKHRNFDLQYEGGATIYHDNSELNSNFDRLSVSEEVIGRKTSLLIDDDFTYFPEAPYGTGGFNLTGGALPAGVSDIASSLLPEQNILGQKSSRLSNSISAHTDYALSGKRSITAFGSYGLLRFDNPSFIDSDQYGFGLGFNQRLSTKDTVSANFDTSLFGFTNSQLIRTHVVNLEYSRVLSAKFSADVAGGPQFTILDNIATGSSTLISYSMQSSLRYRAARNELGIFFSHGVTGGSGVLTGAKTTSVQGYLTRSITRLWSGQIGVGYTRNAPIATIAGGSPDIGTQQYNTTFCNFSVSRVVSRNFDVSVGYLLQNQTSATPNSLSTFGIRHVVSVGLTWRHQPIVIR